MKEFLDTEKLYTYVKDTAKRSEDWIEIPEGMNFAYKNEFSVHFTKLEMGYRDSIIVWQREKIEVKDKKLDIKKVMAEAEMFDASNREHGHYYKDVSGLNIIDPYMVLKLFNVTDPCLQHIVKKALVAGGRGHKDLERDLKDIHDTSKRALEINNILH